MHPSWSMAVCCFNTNYIIGQFITLLTNRIPSEFDLKLQKESRHANGNYTSSLFCESLKKSPVSRKKRLAVFSPLPAIHHSLILCEHTMSILPSQQRKTENPSSVRVLEDCSSLQSTLILHNKHSIIFHLYSEIVFSLALRRHSVSAFGASNGLLLLHYSLKCVALTFLKSSRMS